MTRKPTDNVNYTHLDDNIDADPDMLVIWREKKLFFPAFIKVRKHGGGLVIKARHPATSGDGSGPAACEGDTHSFWINREAFEELKRYIG